jgi:hypothetical protein
MRLNTVLLRAAILAGGTALAACSLFETRDPLEPPPPVEGCRALTGGPNAAVIPNVEDFYARVSDLTCYYSTLDTSFIFHPDAIDSSDALPQTPFVNWDDDVEKSVASNIANVADFMEVDFQGEYSSPIISPDQTTEVRFYNYQLRLSLQSAPDTVRFTGQADLTFHRGADGQWKITDWVDRRGGVADSTWGFLRSQFRF